MNKRDFILIWAERGAISDAPAALGLAGVLPSVREWRLFLDRLLLWCGAVALAAAVVFFVAHNWNELGRYAKFGLLELLVVAAVAGYWRLGPDRASGKASLVAASILLGALLAFFGQTYQTGADTWELFATWFALMLPWVIIGRFAGLWMLSIVIANTASALYFQAFPGLLGMVFNTERQLWTLFAFNTACLVAWELAARRIAWLNERWAPRLLLFAGGLLVTALAIQGIFRWDFRGSEQSGAALLIHPLWLVCLYAAYRHWRRDLFAIAGACLSAIVVVTAFLSKHLLAGRAAEANFLFIGAIVIVMAAAAGWWLKQIASEEGAQHAD